MNFRPKEVADWIKSKKRMPYRRFTQANMAIASWDGGITCSCLGARTTQTPVSPFPVTFLMAKPGSR